jgi:hypothetical protein
LKERGLKEVTDDDTPRGDGTVMLSARIDAELRRRFHHRAIDENTTVQELLTRLVREYLDHAEAPGEKPSD